MHSLNCRLHYLLLTHFFFLYILKYAIFVIFMFYHFYVLSFFVRAGKANVEIMLRFMYISCLYFCI